MKSKIIVTGIVFLFFVNVVFSGEIHPGLQKHIEKLGDNENVKVIFIFNGKQPKEVLDVMKSEGAKIKRSFSIIDAASADFPTDGNPQDYYGHGTHVSGIIASNDATYKGVAPGTRIMNVKVLNQYGWGYESDVVAGIEYSVNNGAEVISMSLGG